MTLLAPPPGLVVPDWDAEPPIEDVEAAVQAADSEQDLADLIRYLRARLAIGWRLSPSAMAAYLTGGVFRRWRYVELLSRQFVKATTGQSKRQIWNLPSRYGKTLICQWGCVWLLDATEGRVKLMLVSWGDTLAREKSAEMRNMARAYGDRLRFSLSPDQQRQDRWTTPNGGGLFASGIDGGMYGFGAGNAALSAELEVVLHGGILVDDPFRDWITASRAGQREHVFNQYRGVVRNRLDDEDGWIIVVHHRLHDEDITGKLLDAAEQGTGEKWELVSLPARAYDDGTADPIGRAPGEPLEPERFPPEAVESRALGMGPYLANAQEQQRPTRDEGTVLKRAWFVLAEPSELPPKPARAITSWDLKLKDREAGDYVVGQVWWAIGDARWCVDQIRGQYDHATTEVAIVLLQVRHPEVRTNYVESAASADEIIPEVRKPRPTYSVPPEIAAELGMTDEEVAKVNRIMRAGMGNVKAESVTQASKHARAIAYIAPPAAQGNVRIPAEAPWAATWLEEMTSFPTGLHDDQVDTASQALKVLVVRTGGAGIAAPTGAIPR